ncbi:MAG: hypothetical protein GXN99_01570, partial [Candidatus Nanohaloarchaeota archaeon]|nr:hypothetical protein [Candidatus Nanohaloarchaeota archaeon]
LIKYSNNYEEFKFKKEILDELLKAEGYELVDVFLSPYSYNSYLLYERRK